MDTVERDFIDPQELDKVFDVVIEVTLMPLPALPMSGVETRLKRMGATLGSYGLPGVVIMGALSALAKATQSAPLVSTTLPDLLMWPLLLMPYATTLWVLFALGTASGRIAPVLQRSSVRVFFSILGANLLAGMVTNKLAAIVLGDRLIAFHSGDMSLMWLSCEVLEGFIVALERLIHFGKMS
jgi:hypothetical protein